MTIFNKIKNLFAGKAKNESVAKTATVHKATKTVAKTVKAKALDFFKFASTDKTRYFMNGVYHEGGAKIATDGRILVMAKSEYDTKFEGVILSKSLVPIDGQFPNYKRVLPDFSKMEKAEFDLAEVKKELKEFDSMLRIHKKLTSKPSAYILSNGSCVNVDYLKKIIHFAECYSDSVLYVSNENTRVCVLASGDVDNPTAMCVFMPMNIQCAETYYSKAGNFLFGGDFSEFSEKTILNSCRKSDILQRKEYGTMTEKDIAFLKDVHDFIAIFRKEKAA